MKHLRLYLVGAAIYALTLVAAWFAGTNFAYDQTVTMLKKGEEIFCNAINDSVDIMVMHSCMEMLGLLDNHASPVSTAQLEKLSEIFQIDEINVVDTNGTCIASTEAVSVGLDYRDSEETSAFLQLLSEQHFLVQDFRASVNNPQHFRKYCGMPFPDGSGFVQLGMDFCRIPEHLAKYSYDPFVYWSMGKSGGFGFNDSRHGGEFDIASEGVPDGVVVRRLNRRGEAVYLRSFTYCGFSFYVIIPEAEYFEDRNLDFAIVAIVLGLFLLLFINYAIKADKAKRLVDFNLKRVAAARERDLVLARRIQMASLPSMSTFLCDHLRLSFAGRTVPAKEVGGDFYDFDFLDQDHFGFLIADVTGKGIAAAMFMMEAKEELTHALRAESNLAVAIAQANRRICARNELELFVTAWVGVLDMRTGAIKYVNAGHNRPFVRRRNGIVEKVCGKGGPFLGSFPDVEFKVNEIQLQPEEGLLLYTDGITEAMNEKRELFGEERLKRILPTFSPSPEEALEAIRVAVHAFENKAEQSDDMTAFTLVWHGLPARKERTFPTAMDSLSPAMSWLRETIALKDRKAIARLLNAADEIMTNIIQYSNSPDFTLGVENAPGRTRLTFSDSGVKYDPLSHEDPDVHTRLADRQVGGLGILMTKKLVDSVVYSRTNGQNILSIVKLDS